MQQAHLDTKKTCWLNASTNLQVRKSILLKAEKICMLSITIFHKSDSSSKYLIINNCVHMQVYTQDSLLAKLFLSSLFRYQKPSFARKGFLNE